MHHQDAMAQHKNAKPKPKGWLLAVVDTVYKDGESASHGQVQTNLDCGISS
jgi:hypothetical protein